MSAPTLRPSSGQPLGHALDLSGTRSLPFGRLVRVELRKTYDTRAGRWLLICMGILTALVMGIQLAVVVVQDISVGYRDFMTSTSFSIAILLPILGILLLTSEWGQRTAMVTFTLEPRRPRVPDRDAMDAILLVLRTGMQWNALNATGICSSSAANRSSITSARNLSS